MLIAVHEDSFFIIRCERCKCKPGQYQDLQSSSSSCTTGRELSMPGCLPCSATCAPEGEYVQGSCDGTQTTNAMKCVPCTILAASQTPTPPAGSRTCPAAGTLPVRRGSQTVVYSASEFRSDCTDRRGLDCMRRQALMYPFDGNDLLEDLAPWARRLVPVSASGRSKGPSIEAFEVEPQLDSDTVFQNVLKNYPHSRTAAAKFNATNHEYYSIPPMSNVFDPSLAVRVIAASSSSSAQQRKVVWEQGATLCLWYKFASLLGSWQTLFEMSNGYGTEHVYVRRYADSLDLVFGVEHSGGTYKAEFRTQNGSGIARGGAGYWQHLCWSMRHVLPSNISGTPISSSNSYYLLPESLFRWSSVPTSFSSASSLVAVQAMRMGYAARWSIYINGGQGDPFWSYENVDGMVMPVEGSYSISYVGYGTLFSGAFFSGSIADLRLYERPLDMMSIRAIFSGDSCCTAFAAGSYMDPSIRCKSGMRLNSEFCRACKQDCGPLRFIDNEDNACSGKRTADFTLCKPCAPCAQDQYMNRTCSGTSFADEGTCPPCRYKSSSDCPGTGKVMIGRCEGNQIYDTSSCIDCNAECIGSDRDPQRRGQFIEKECSQSPNDYVCKPCSPYCPSGTYVSSLCTGKGRTDTGCRVCKSFCKEAQAGVAGANGQYIAGLCDGTTTSDVQVRA